MPGRQWPLPTWSPVGPIAASAEDLAQEALLEAWGLRDRVYDPAGVPPLTGGDPGPRCWSPTASKLR
jgi:hypothetical protein